MASTDAPAAAGFLASAAVVVWDELYDAPEIPDAVYEQAARRLDRALDALLAVAPDWLKAGAARVEWMIDATPDPDAFAYQSVDEDGVDVVVMTLRAAQEFTHASLVFTLAHELGHAILQPRVQLKGAITDPVALRIRLRAVEPHVNDTLAAYGIHAPACLPVPGGAISGRSAVGFDVGGCSRREIWDALTGAISLIELAEIARSRPAGHIASDPAGMRRSAGRTRTRSRSGRTAAARSSPSGRASTTTCAAA